MVALLVSAWIEIISTKQITVRIRVALLVSAWIEIAFITALTYLPTCRTPRECVD